MWEKWKDVSNSSLPHSRYPTALRNILREVTGLGDLCKSKIENSDKVSVDG